MLEAQIREVLKCTRCGKCVATCPVFEELGWESTSARGRMLLSKALAEKAPVTSRLYDGIYTCTTCGYCSAICPSGAQPEHVVEIARREILLKGIITDRIKIMNDSVQKYGNPLREGKPRYEWMPSEIKLKPEADLVYFAGCLTSYRYPDVAQATIKILNRFGATMLPNEQCCGSPLIRLGEIPAATMEANVKQIKESKAKTVVTSCAGCFKTLSKDYSLNGVEIKHISQFLADHLGELNLNRLNLRVTYHDPCHLGRHSKIYDPPRRVIKQICEFTEMRRTKDRARCCGGGGGVRSGYPDLSLAIAKKRISDLPDNVDYVITACPMCYRNLSEAGLKVLDLVKLVEMALGKIEVEQSQN